MMLFRKIESLIEDHLQSDSKKILLIDGARQVGKTYIIRHVGHKLFENFIEINMVEDSIGPRLFAETKTVEDFYLQVSMLEGSKMKQKDNTLIFIDEIQAYPHLLTLLKFLSQDDRFTYIASGSLLGVTLSQTTSIPMGSIRKVRMFPLDFEEFLYANGLNEFAVSAMRKKFERLEALDEPTHNKMMDYFRKYLLVGGLPDAVNSYLENHNIQFVREIQQEIHDYYAADASKYDEERKLKIRRTGGLYYGVNAVSRNLIICNRDAMLNGHGLYMGVSGSGKSMMAKQEIGFVGLNTDHDIIVVDPEREYGPLIRALGGEVITISASNGSYVNALDISKEYGDGRNPLVLKSEFIMSLCEQLMGAGEIGAKEKSIIDRCTVNIYRKYIRKYEGDPPTLKDLYDDLMRQKEPVAHEIALALELFTTGSLNVFAHKTNIDTRNRIICYDIQDLGENLKPIGLLVMLDSILNRVIRNRQQGRYTHVYIDEIYLFFASPGVGGKSAINNYSSEFLYKCWKRFRKYYATLTGITQNVEECLLSDTARLMFANSEFLVLLNQAPTDRAELAKLLDASDAQMDYVSDAPAGHGLIKVGSCLVPFINELPRDTELYRLMTTKPGEQNA